MAKREDPFDHTELLRKLAAEVRWAAAQYDSFQALNTQRMRDILTDVDAALVLAEGDAK